LFRHIRSKLIAAFAVPLAILVAVAGLEVSSSLRQMTSVDSQAALATASVGPEGLVQALQTEREYAVLSILSSASASLPSPLSGLNPTSAGLDQPATAVVQATNLALAGFRQSVAKAGSQAQATYQNALSALDGLTAARDDWAPAKRGTGQPASYEALFGNTYTGYTTIINTLISATAQVPLNISNPTLRTGVEALSASLQSSEAQWQTLEELFQASWTSGYSQAQAIAAATQAWGAAANWTQQLTSLGTGPYAAAVGALETGAQTATGEKSLVAASLGLDMEIAQNGTVPPLEPVIAAFSWPAPGSLAGSSVTATALGESKIAAVVTNQANALHRSAVEKAALFGALGAIGTFLGLLLVILVSRSVSKPLVRLAERAKELAATTLPATVQAILDAETSGAEPPEVPRITVGTRDETADMARAIDAVKRTAIELATGQAALRRGLAEAFVNLGRRNQNLVTRQLEYISELELKEADPASLEDLFRLDHLATRMRRNAESLLILAGSGPAREWSTPVPAMDLARAASAEVEDYRRLRLHHFDSAMVSGEATTDLVHILAEMIENALSYSPPDTPVDIYGRVVEGAYVIAVVDSGIGMTAEDIATANLRLKGEGATGEVPGRYLGHFVAGHLAARHGISISLQPARSGGLVARIKIPAALTEQPVPDLSSAAELLPSPTQQVPPRGSTSKGALANFSAGPPSRQSSWASYDDGISDGTGAFEATVAEATVAEATVAEATVAEATVAEATVAEATVAAHAALHHAGPATTGPSRTEAVPGRLQPRHAIAATIDTTPGTRSISGPLRSDALRAADTIGTPPTGSQSASAATAWAVAASAAAAAAALRELSGASRRESNERPVPNEDHKYAEHGTPGPAWHEDPASLPPINLGQHGRGGASAWNPPTSLVIAPSAASPSGEPVKADVDHNPITASHARTTAEGLRKLTRRVPGAALPHEDGALRRPTSTSTTSHPLGLPGALSKYLSATAIDGQHIKRSTTNDEH